MEVSTTFPDKDNDTSVAALTPRDAYLAMYYFVKAYWERGGRRDGSVTMLSHDLSPSEDVDPQKLMTTDPAFWDDWLAAVEKAQTEGLPAER